MIAKIYRNDKLIQKVEANEKNMLIYLELISNISKIKIIKKEKTELEIYILK